MSTILNEHRTKKQSTWQKCHEPNMKVQEGSSAVKEYEMMRTEILQDLEEYQSVRNMMYLATAAILGVNGLMFQNYYLFLLPLIVICPSYMIFYNYWKSVSCVSTYIQVFLDEEAGQTTYHWELRHRYFAELHEMDKIGVNERIRGLDMHSHQIPYLLCSGLCLIPGGFRFLCLTFTTANSLLQSRFRGRRIRISFCLIEQIHLSGESSPPI